MVAPKLVSVTDLCALRFCPRALYLRLVLGFREPAKPVMVLGSIRHKVFEEANKVEEALVRGVEAGVGRQDVLASFESVYADVLKRGVSAFSSDLQRLGILQSDVSAQLSPAVLEQARQRADEVLSFSSKTGLFGGQLWDGLSPKIISELYVASERLHLKARVDRVEVYGSEYVPVEIKTGRAPSEGVWPDHRLQLSAYMLLLGEKYNSSIKEGIVRYVSSNQQRQVVMNPFMEYEVKGAVNDVFALMENKDIPNVCGKGYCTVCQLGDGFEGVLVRKASY